MEIKNSYLMWIGSEHYKTIEDWTKEALEQGVSKRLPNRHMGKALMEPGSVVFVAHDEGEMDECEHCTAPIECPDCRKLQASYDREAVLSVKFAEEAKEASASKERARLLKLAGNAQERANKAIEAQESCETCLGTSRVEAGSGGTVTFEDGESWDYRRYNYHLHQPKRWTATDKGGLSVVSRCEHCGGTGRIPNAKVFGLFVPEAIEYIESADTEKTEEAKALGFDIVSSTTLSAERKRGCGKRKAGGVYASTRASSTSKAGAEAVKALGLDSDACEVRGNFVSFVEPIVVNDTKRFRGLAKWELPSGVEDEAEMIAEAL